MTAKRWSDAVQPLEDMVANAAEAVELLGNAAPGWWDRDKTLRYAVLHLVQVVGEAARRVPPEVRAIAPEIPWVRVVGIRSFIVHEYDRLDMAVVHDVVANRFPPLVEELSDLIATVRKLGEAPLK